MRGRIFTGLILCCLPLVVRGDAQSSALAEKPVWTLEVIKVSPEKYGPTLGELDELWMRVRDEAKRQGIVLAYHCISDAGVMTPDHTLGDPTSIVLLTEYKNINAYTEREKTFASIREHLPHNTPGVLKRGDDLYKSTDGHVFMEVPAAGSAEFKLLAKQ
jgi:hypothetical protein